jgi:hypothetical protein
VRQTNIFANLSTSRLHIFARRAGRINGGKADVVAAAAGRMKEPRLAATKVDG